MKTPVLKLLAAAVFVGGLTSTALAQNLIANGSFLVNPTAFTNWLGYISGNTTIPSWSASAPGLEGINGAGTSDVFGPSNTGGRTYAFIQNGGNYTQPLPGSYVAGQTYPLDLIAGTSSKTDCDWTSPLTVF